MPVLNFIKSRCISFLEILRKLGQKLVSPLSKKKRPTRVTVDMTETLGEGGKLSIHKQCLYERIPHSGLTRRRAHSVPSVLTHYDQDQIVMVGDGTVPEGHSGQMSVTIQSTLGKQETVGSGKMLEMNSSLKASNLIQEINGVSVKSEVEEEGTKKKAAVNTRKISTAVSVGVIGAKLASLFFTVHSLMQTNNEENVLDEEIVEL